MEPGVSGQVGFTALRRGNKQSTTRVVGKGRKCIADPKDKTTAVPLSEQLLHWQRRRSVPLTSWRCKQSQGFIEAQIWVPATARISQLLVTSN